MINRPNADSGQAVGCTDMQTERQTYTDKQIQMLTDKLASSHAHTDRQTDRETYTKGHRDEETDIDIHVTGHYTARQSDLHFMHSYWQMELWTDRHIDK